MLSIIACEKVMAPPSTPKLGYVLFFILLTSAICPITGCFESIISFGDSLADTGNLLRLAQSNVVKPRCSRLPYGETFFNRPNGRYSDGRLVVDFLAESFGLPLVQPIVGGENSNLRGQSFEKGVNFAVAGATALDHEYLEARGIYNPLTNVSLGVQMSWFKRFLGTRQVKESTLRTICCDCVVGLLGAVYKIWWIQPGGTPLKEKSLILLGEIGGNDYSHALTLGMNREVLQSLVPTVVEYIGSTLVELIKLGAETILVPGNFPKGCVPVYLTQFKSDDETNYYDPQTGCINWLNEFSRYHNGLLEKELNRIREFHPRISIIYADYYNAPLQFFISPNEFGFGKGSVLSACCGGGGLYNYNVSVVCGFPSATCCEDPSLFVSWDGVHLTEAAYRFLAQDLLEGNYTVPHLSTICSPSSRIPGFY